MTTTAINIAEGLGDARKAGLGRISDLQSLIHLASVNHATASTLALVAGISDAAATGLVDRLAKAGFVNRYHGTHDRRLVLTAITTKGRELITPFLP
jgi:DNA-binding MarR family transcriptional regulator